mgnify:CR=1 FL=1
MVPPISTRWHSALSSPRGFAIASGLTLGVALLTILLAGYTFRVLTAPPPLLGEPVPYPSSTHVPDGALGPNPGLTPAGGHHYARPLPTGIYPSPVTDGHAIHSLAHGIVWLTYQPDQISDAELDTLEAIAADFPVDTILAPRLENSFPVIVVSWEQRLTMEHLDEQALRDFVSTNRNRSPEPGVR